MADFGISLLELQNAAAQIIYGLDYAGTGVTTARLDVLVDDGVRQFYTPIIRGPGGRPHIYIWSFLHNTTTIKAFKAKSGTHTTDPGTGTTLTDTAGSFKGDTAASGAELVGEVVTTTDVSAGTTFTNTVTTITSDTALEVTAAFDDAIIVTDTYVISLDGNYNLPADFGGLVGRLTFDSTTGFSPISVTSESRIREWRQDSRRTQTQRPSQAAVRPRTEGVDTTGQRFELMLWPKPDADYTLHYRYIKIVTNDTSDTGNFFPGGPFHSQTLLSSVRAAAEDSLVHTHPNRPRHWQQRFREQLEASIAFDQASMSPETLGISYDAGLGQPSDSHFISHFGSPTTFGGVLYP